MQSQIIGTFIEYMLIQVQKEYNFDFNEVTNAIAREDDLFITMQDGREIVIYLSKNVNNEVIMEQTIAETDESLIGKQYYIKGSDISAFPGISLNKEAYYLSVVKSIDRQINPTRVRIYVEYNFIRNSKGDVPLKDVSHAFVQLEHLKKQPVKA